MSRWCSRYLLQHIFILSIVCLVITSSAVCAFKFGDFPGKGSKQVWLQANNHLNEGIDLGHKEAFDQAINELKAAIRMYPDDAKYYYNLAGCYEGRDKPGDMIRAEQTYRQSIRLAPSIWETWNALATPLYVLGKYSESKAAKLEALRLNPPAEDVPGIKSDIEKISSKIRSTTGARTN